MDCGKVCRGESIFECLTPDIYAGNARYWINLGTRLEVITAPQLGRARAAEFATILHLPPHLSKGACHLDQSICTDKYGGIRRPSFGSKGLALDQVIGLECSQYDDYSNQYAGSQLRRLEGSYATSSHRPQEQLRQKFNQFMHITLPNTNPSVVSLLSDRVRVVGIRPNKPSSQRFVNSLRQHGQHPSMIAPLFLLLEQDKPSAVCLHVPLSLPLYARI